MNEQQERIEFKVKGGTITVHVTMDGKLSVAATDGHAIAVHPRGANAIYIVPIPFKEREHAA